MIDDFANPDTLDDIQQCIVFMQDLAIGSRDNQVFFIFFWLFFWGVLLIFFYIFFLG